MKYQAILFDLDGTLVNTVGLYGRVCMKAFADHGVELTEQSFRDYYVTGESIERWFHRLSGGKEMPKELRPHRDELYSQILLAECAYLDDAHRILAHTAKTPRAIVTGSWRKHVDAIHEKLGIDDHFEHIICCDDMGKYMKPHPHGLFLACDRLGIKPEDCLVIGDQTFEIDAAKAAGMQSCLVWSSHTPKHAAGKANHEVGSLKELKILLS